MRRVKVRIGIVAVAGLLVFGSMSIALAQYRMGAGHSLDASLKVGSGGYNRPAHGGRMSRHRYGVGSSRPVYSVRMDGEMRYNRNNAFARGRYGVTGSQGGFGRAHHHRYRYTGRY